MARKEGDKPELLSREEMRTLMLSVAHQQYFYTLYKVLLHTGCRIGEIYGTKRDNGKVVGGIRVNDVDFTSRTIKLITLKTKKRKLKLECTSCNKTNSHKSKYCVDCGKPLPTFDKSRLKYAVEERREVPMHPDLVPILQTYIKVNKLKSTSFLFHEMSLIYVKKAIKKHMKLSGIKKNFSIHGFRHYFISRMIESGLPDDQIIRWTGHKSKQSLTSYNQLTPKDVAASVLKVEL